MITPFSFSVFVYGSLCWLSAKLFQDPKNMWLTSHWWNGKTKKPMFCSFHSIKPEDDIKGIFFCALFEDKIFKKSIGIMENKIKT